MMDRAYSHQAKTMDTVSEMLRKSGVRIYSDGKRADCPDCTKIPGWHGRATVSIDNTRGVYKCHEGGCDFKGNDVILARRLGLTPDKRDYKRIEQAERFHKEVEREVHPRIHELRKLHMKLLSAGMNATLERHQGHGAFEAHRRLPMVRAELLLLETARDDQRKIFMHYPEGRRREMLKDIIEKGGLRDSWQRWVNLDDYRIGGKQTPDYHQTYLHRR